MFDKKSRVTYLYFILSISLSLLSFSKAVNADTGLILAVHPYLTETEIQKKFAPLAKYLSQEMGQTVQVKVGGSYEEHIRYIGLNKVDIAYMGPASYVQMVIDFGEKPVLARLEVSGHSWFQGDIVARENSEIKTLNDLKGKRIAFGDPKSTMSYIVPHHMMHQAGVFDGITTSHQFLYSHDNVALGVLSGDFDAGAVKPAVSRKFKSAGLRTIAKTPKISEHLFVVRADLAPKQVEMLRNIMLTMSESEKGMEALHAIKKNITALVEVESSDYDNLRKIIVDSKGF